MNVSGIFEGLQQGQSPAGRSLAFEADRDITHIVGSIIKGKVMRHYEGSRYSVSFGGREKVVDSSIPLTTGELIRGRVVAIDDKVHMQRIFVPDIKQNHQQASINSHLHEFDQQGVKAILPLFEQYQVRLTTADFQIIRQLTGGASDSRLMALSALLLIKIGSHLEPEFVRAIYRFLKDDQTVTRLLNIKNIPALEVSTSTITQDAETSSEHHLWAILSGFIQRQSHFHSINIQDVTFDDGVTSDHGQEDTTGNDDSSNTDDHDSHQQHMLGERLLNVQNDNSVAHRLINLPVWFDDRLVEVRLAFFSQKQGQQAEHQTATGQYKKIVFSLDTNHLGHIEVKVNLLDRRVRVEFASDRTEVSALMSQHAGEVRSSLTDLNWQIDEMSYNTVPDFEEGALHAVVEHYVSQDSFNRLM